MTHDKEAFRRGFMAALALAKDMALEESQRHRGKAWAAVSALAVKLAMLENRLTGEESPHVTPRV